MRNENLRSFWIKVFLFAASLGPVTSAIAQTDIGRIKTSDYYCDVLGGSKQGEECHIPVPRPSGACDATLNNEDFALVMRKQSPSSPAGKLNEANTTGSCIPPVPRSRIADGAAWYRKESRGYVDMRAGKAAEELCDPQKSGWQSRCESNMQALYHVYACFLERCGSSGDTGSPSTSVARSDRLPDQPRTVDPGAPSGANSYFTAIAVSQYRDSGWCVADTEMEARRCALDWCGQISTTCTIRKVCSGGGYGAIVQSSKRIFYNCGMPSIDSAVSAARRDCDRYPEHCSVVARIPTDRRTGDTGSRANPAQMGRPQIPTAPAASEKLRTHIPPPPATIKPSSAAQPVAPDGWVFVDAGACKIAVHKAAFIINSSGRRTWSGACDGGLATGSGVARTYDSQGRLMSISQQIREGGILKASASYHRAADGKISSVVSGKAQVVPVSQIPEWAREILADN
jgi:hypothetical protein